MDTRQEAFDPDKHCTNCGWAHKHPDSSGGYCRRCATEGGSGFEFRTEIDHDRLRAFVGEELATEILNECQYDLSEPTEEELVILRLPRSEREIRRAQEALKRLDALRALETIRALGSGSRE